MLIPTVIALSSFFASNFPNISWYPYWYLGNPYQFLIGPVVPTFLTIFNFQFSIFNSYLGLIFLSLFLGALGVYLLLKDWGVGKRQAILSAILYLILPAGFYLLNFQNGLNHIAFGLLPFIFILYRRWLEKNHLGGGRMDSPEVIHGLLLSIAIAFVLLIDISILLVLIIGFTALFFALENKGDWGDLVIKSVLIVLLGISLATIWYTPKFWWILLANPSFGGVPLFNLIISLFKLLLNLLPLVLAVIFVKWRRYKPKGYLLFAVLFFSSFFFLTLVRFFSDPDFVTDWIGFFLELQFGGAIILGNLLNKFSIFNFQFLMKSQFSNSQNKNSMKISNFKFQTRKVFVFVIAFTSIAISLVMVRGLFTDSRNDYQQRILSLVKNNVKLNERIFLSGSSVFFINSFLNISQIRGGVDQASIHPSWAQGAYQIREGTKSDLARDWLVALGVSYVLVHEKESLEPFRDFKHPQKFAGFKLIAANKGDKLYGVEGAGIARIADAKILEIPKPKLSQYASFLKRPLDSSFKKPNEILIKGKFGQDEVVSLAVSYDSGWRLIKGQGSILSDSLGNIVIIPKEEGQQEFILAFKENNLSRWLSLVFGLITMVFLINSKVLSGLKKRFPSFSLGFREDDY